MSGRELHVSIGSVTVIDDSDDIGAGTITMNLYINYDKIRLTSDLKIDSRFGVVNLLTRGAVVPFSGNVVSALFTMFEHDPGPFDTNDSTNARIDLDLAKEFRPTNWRIIANGGSSQDGLAGYIDFRTQIFPAGSPPYVLAFEHVACDGNPIHLMSESNRVSYPVSGVRLYETICATMPSQSNISSIYMPEGLDCSVEIISSGYFRRRRRGSKKSNFPPASIVLLPDVGPTTDYIRPRVINLIDLSYGDQGQTWNDRITLIRVKVYD